MSELKHTFTLGRMNKDLDERLIPNGEYRDALNIQVSTSEGSDVGAIENVLGNDAISSLELTNGVCIGSVSDKLNKTIYWFITSDELDAIYEYNTLTKKVCAIVIDPKTNSTNTISSLVFRSNIDDDLIIDNLSIPEAKEIFNINDADFPVTSNQEALISNNVIITVDNPSISLTIPKNTILCLDPESGYIFKNVKYTNADLGDLTVKFEFSNSSVLDFSKNHLITGANVLNDILYFNDNLNQPRAININEFRRYSDELLLNNGSYSKTEQTKVTGEIFISKDIKQKFEREFEEKDIIVARKAPQTAPSLVLKNTIRDGKVTDTVQKNFYTNNVLVRPDNSDPSFTITYADLPDWKVGDKILSTPDEIDINGDPEPQEWEAVAIITEILVNSKQITFNILSYTEIPDDKIYVLNQELMQDNPIYELTFPRFAYRWKYKDNTYSTFSPFSEVAFLPGDFKYDGKNAFNEGVINNARKIILNDIDLGDESVKEIDILLKKDNDNNVYIISNEKRKDFFGTIEITKEQIKSTIDNKQLLRQWDNIPKRAKAQEIVSNRIIYGNYVQNYNIYNDPDFTIIINKKTDDSKKSLKSDRTYEFGVVYVDEYNRQTPVLAGKNSVITIPKSSSIDTSEFKIKLNNIPPAWAKYFKYFIKESSNEYYNLAADRFYPDEENGFMYISFPSADRNKVTEENYLLFKKNHGNDKAVIAEDNRYKIIDISNEPPEFITARKRVILSLGDIVFTDDYGGSGGGTTVTNKTDAANNAPLKDFASIQIKQANGSSDGVPLADTKEIRPGRFASFEYLGKESRPYEIKRLSQHPSGDNEIKIDFEEPFDEDVEIIYQKASGNIGDTSTNFGVNLNISEEFSAAGDKEFDGRFFIKIRINSTLQDGIIKQTFGGKEYFAKESIPLIGVYSKNEDSKRNSDNYNNTARGRDNARKDPDNEFVVSHGGNATPGSTENTGKRRKVGSLEYNISLECATYKMEAVVEQLAKRAKVGNFVRFINKDGTPIGDNTIYEIGSVYVERFKEKRGRASRKHFKRINFRFVDDEGEFQPLLNDICVRNQNTWDNEPRMEILEERDNEKTTVVNPGIFETEPLESKTDLDIYFETSKAYSIIDHGTTQTLKYFNCFSFKNGVESNRIRDDFNAPFIKNGVKASTVLEEGYKEERVYNGLIWSGIINPNSSVNNSNQFIQAESITKNFLPSYGKIQKLHAWDDSLVVFLENKVLRTPANKSALFNADGSTNLISTNRVIGDPIEYNGDFGISNDPQSFSAFGFRCYFVDRKNGKIFRLSKDGLTPISDVNMSDFFSDRLETTQTIFGSYDEGNNLYNLSFGTDNDTVCFSEAVNGWSTRKSFVPQYAISLNSSYYTFSNGDMWIHGASGVPRNNFYGIQSFSEVQLEINDDPSTVKKFKTLVYEGTKGWTADIKTDLEKSNDISFKSKENKYFANISGENKTVSNLDLKKFNFQGIGRPSSIDTIADNRTNTTLKFTAELDNLSNVTATEFNIVKLPNEKINQTIAVIALSPPAGFTLIAKDFKQITKTGFTDKLNSTITQNGVGVLINYTHGIVKQPDSNTTIKLLFDGKMIQNNVSLSGAHTQKLEGVTSNIIDDTYTLTGKPNTEKTILERTITADTDFEIFASDIICDNPAIKLIITEIARGVEYRILEKTVLPSSTETGRDYKITAVATSVKPQNKKISSRTLDTSNALFLTETRTLQIFGEEGAIIKYKFTDSSSTLQEETLTIDSSGKLNVQLLFPAGTANNTFTIAFTEGTLTEFDTNSWQGNITINRVAKVKKTVKVTANFGSFSDFTSFTVDSGTRLSSAHFIELTVTAANHKVLQFPTNDDFQIVPDTTGTNTITFSGISLVALTPGGGSNTNLLKLQFFIDIDSVDHDDEVFIDLTDYVGRDVTITTSFNATTTGGTDTSAGGLYTITQASPNTINGSAGLPASTNSIYTYQLTIASGKELIPGTTADDFDIFDGSNNNVTSIYNDDDTLDIRQRGNNLFIDFKPGTFNMPSTDTTLTIRPTKAIVQTFVQAVDYQVHAKNLVRELGVDDFTASGINFTPTPWPIFKNKYSSKTTASSGTKLIQFFYTIDRRSNQPDQQKFSKWSNTNNSITFIGGSNTELSLATAGSYAPIQGGSNISVSGGFEVTNNSSTYQSILTVNILLNTANIPAGKKVGTIEVHAGVNFKEEVKNKTTLPAATQKAAEALTKNLDYGYWNLDFSTSAPKVNAWVAPGYDPGTRFGGNIATGPSGPFVKDTTLNKIYRINTSTGRIQEILDIKANVPTHIANLTPASGTYMEFKEGPRAPVFINPFAFGDSYRTADVLDSKWLFITHTQVANAKSLFENANTVRFQDLKDIGIEMRIEGLTEEALDKYQGSFHTKHIRKGKNLTGGKMESKKNYNGNNSSIELKSTVTLNYTFGTQGYLISSANLEMFHFFSSAWNRDMGKGQIASVFTNWSSSRSKSKAYQLYGQRVGIIYPVNGRNAFIL